MAASDNAAQQPSEDGFRPHTSHWGVFSARMKEGQLEVRPHEGDPDPNEIIQNFPAALRHRARIAQPMVRRGWLENGPGPDDRRGRHEYVPMSWSAVLDRLAAELRRVRDDHGPGAIFGGSYGWASARALPPRPEPDPPLPRRFDRRLCEVGQQLLLRRLPPSSCRISSATTRSSW
ncbi:molybdopterin-dependent oxidoreductase [Bosea thiooxidans]